MADDKKLQTELERILIRAKSREGAQNTLALLFPKIEGLLETYVPSESSDGSTRKLKRRISQSDFSRNYFRLTPETTSWGRNETAEALSSPSKAFEILWKKLEKSQNRERSKILRIFLELLDSAFVSGKDFDEAWLKCMIHQSVALVAEDSHRTRSLFDLNVLDRLRIIVLHGLKNKTPRQRFDLLSEGILTAKDLSLICDVVRSILPDTNPEGSRSSQQIDLGSNGEEIRRLLLHEICVIAASGKFWSQAEPNQLIWFWWGSDRGDDVRTFLDSAMGTRKGLLALLKITVNTVGSSTGNYERVNRSTWSKLVELDELEFEAKALLSEEPDESEREIADRFLKALERGKSSRF